MLLRGTFAPTESGTQIDITAHPLPQVWLCQLFPVGFGVFYVGWCLWFHGLWLLFSWTTATIWMVLMVIWFTLHDATGDPDHELNRLSRILSDY